MESVNKFEMVDINSLIPYVNNARTHSPEQITKLRSSLREFGFINPVIVDKNLNVLAGHGRIEAAKLEGIKEVPCVFEEHLTEAQRKAYILADNRLALDSDYNEELLKVEIESLQDMAYDLSLTGFDDKELADLLNLDAEVPDDNYDLDAALQKASFAMTGDRWQVGRHVLYVGDATNEGDMNRLMEDKVANVVITDPPYGVSFKSKSGLSIKNDSLKDDEFYNFLLSAFKNMYAHLEKGGIAYVFYAEAEAINFRKAFIDANFHFSCNCIWNKGSFVLSHADYMYCHEPVIYGWKEDGTHKFYGDRTNKTVWDFAKPKANKVHPTMKPLDLLSYPMGNSSQANSIILDPFGGSGSTLMAAEKMNRICYTMELDEKYASVILRRYVEDGGNPDDVFVIRNGEKIYYKDLVIELDEKGLAEN